MSPRRSPRRDAHATLERRPGVKAGQRIEAADGRTAPHLVELRERPLQLADDHARKQLATQALQHGPEHRVHQREGCGRRARSLRPARRRRRAPRARSASRRESNRRTPARRRAASGDRRRSRGSSGPWREHWRRWVRGPPRRPHRSTSAALHGHRKPKCHGRAAAAPGKAARTARSRSTAPGVSLGSRSRPAGFQRANFCRPEDGSCRSNRGLIWKMAANVALEAPPGACASWRFADQPPIRAAKA